MERQIDIADIPADLRQYQPHRLGWEPKDPRDIPARAGEARAEILPSTFRIHDPFPVRDQGAIGSCTGMAAAALLQHFFWRVAGAAPELSPLQLYYLGRLIDGSVPADAGSYNRSVLKGARRWGSAPEALWPYDGYDTWKMTTEPDYGARFQGTFWKGFQYVACTTLDDIRSSIAQGWGVVAIWTLTYGAYQNRSTGDVPPTYDGEPSNGAHATWFCGYDDERQRLIFRNSWSRSWGDGGYGTLPYSFLVENDPVRTNLNDAWSLRPLR